MGKQSRELEKGEKFGCWTVIGDSGSDHHGRRRYRIKASCCGREAVRDQYSVMHSSAAVCRYCASEKRGTAIAQALKKKRAVP